MVINTVYFNVQDRNVLKRTPDICTNNVQDRNVLKRTPDICTHTFSMNLYAT